MSRERNMNLAVQREQLRLRSAQLREQIAGDTQVLQPGFRLVDRLRGGAQMVHRAQNKQALLILLGSALAGATLVRPRFMVNMGLRAWSGWQVFRRVQPLIGSLLR